MNACLMEFMADGTLVGPEFFGHGFVHNGHPRRMLVVCLDETPAFEKLDAHGAKIVGRDVIQADDGPGGARRHFVSGDFYPVIIAVVAHGDGKGDARGFYARHRLDPLEELVVELETLLLPVSDVVGVESEVEQVARIKAEIGALDMTEAAHH